jgi:hypothetical protein
VPTDGWLKPIEKPNRRVACSGSPRIVRKMPLWTFGRHARPMFGENCL